MYNLKCTTNLNCLLFEIRPPPFLTTTLTTALSLLLLSLCRISCSIQIAIITSYSLALISCFSWLQPLNMLLDLSFELRFISECFLVMTFFASLLFALHGLSNAPLSLYQSFSFSWSLNQPSFYLMGIEPLINQNCVLYV